MRMRCLGGPNDGEWHDVNTAIHRPGDIYIIHEKKKLSPVGLCDPDKIPEIITQKYNHYRVCLFCSKEDDYYYLVPNNWTDMQGLVFQIERKNINDYSIEELRCEIETRWERGEF